MRKRERARARGVDSEIDRVSLRQRVRENVCVPMRVKYGK